jgi:hypothetical protein
MHVYSNNNKILFYFFKKINIRIYMHSVQNESLCMYIVILLCSVQNPNYIFFLI